MNKKHFFLMTTPFIFLCGCAPSPSPSAGLAYRDGSRAGRVIPFSGLEWRLKESAGLVGPGPNRFAGRPENVWVDEKNRLHMKITKTNETWISSELVCVTPMGYGQYTFYLGSPVDDLDRNAVLGLFTWDDAAFKSQANCEIDIEFSRWTEAGAPNLHYSVQPTRGPDEPSGRYLERYHAFNMKQTDPRSMHVFDWKPDGIDFASYEGHRPSEKKLIDRWHYASGQPARRTGEGLNISEPVGLPAPGPETFLRINLWLVDGNNDKRGDDPADGREIEVIIDRIEYKPAKR